MVSNLGSVLWHHLEPLTPEPACLKQESWVNKADSDIQLFLYTYLEIIDFIQLTN